MTTPTTSTPPASGRRAPRSQPDALRLAGRRATAEVLKESVLQARSCGAGAGLGGANFVRTTRESVDAVLGLLRSARRDTEFAMGVTR